MKTLIVAASAVALSAVAVPALAQTWMPNSYYATLGDTFIQPNSGSFSELNAKLGARWGSYVGAEAELGGGVSNLGRSAGATNYRVSEPVAGAAYGVIFYPLAPNFEVLARMGYGTQNFHITNESNAALNRSVVWNSVNYGIGAQYFLDGKNGVRADYTRRSYLGSHTIDGANTWAVSYVRKF